MANKYIKQDFVEQKERNIDLFQEVKKVTEKLGVLLVDVPEPIEDRENAELLIDSYRYAIELLMKEEVV